MLARVPRDGRKIAQLRSGEWLSHNQNGYHIGSERVATEDAVIRLVAEWHGMSEETGGQSKLEYLLKRHLPESDYSLFEHQRQIDWQIAAREADERWVIKTLQQPAPSKFSFMDYPPFGFGNAWEKLHRIAVGILQEPSGDFIEVASLDLAIAREHFQRLVRLHAPSKTPLRRWEIVHDVVLGRRSLSEIRQEDIQTTTSWFYNENTARLSMSEYTILRVREVTTDSGEKSNLTVN